MAHSTRPLDQILVEGPEYAQWMTPAEARRLIAADPRWEEIEEKDPRYKAVAYKAGVKPNRVIEATEDYGGQNHDL
jgi:hypothetical protein